MIDRIEVHVEKRFLNIREVDYCAETCNHVGGRFSRPSAKVFSCNGHQVLRAFARKSLLYAFVKNPLSDGAYGDGLNELIRLEEWNRNNGK